MSEAGAGEGYPPLDVPKPIAENVWIVDGPPIGKAGIRLPTRMTAVRLADGTLWLHSPIRFEAALAERLAGIGRVRHLVAPNIAHWTFLADWQRQFPDAVTWAAPGLRDRRQVRKSPVRLDHDLSPAPPQDWAAEIDQVVVPGGLGFHELAFFHRASRTLVLTDLVVNVEGARVPALTRAYARLTGTLAPDGSTPTYLRLVIRMRREQAAEAVTRALAWAPDRVVFAHGRWFDRDGAPALRRAMRWLTG